MYINLSAIVLFSIELGPIIDHSPPFLNYKNTQKKVVNPLSAAVKILPPLAGPTPN